MTPAGLSASIVICTLDRPEDIQRCFEALVKQTRRPSQVVVVDAGNLGVTQNVLQNYCRSADIEFIYCQDRPSTTTQRNRGAEFVTSDIVFFVDDDAEMDPQYIDTILRIFEADPDKRIGGATGILSPAPTETTGLWRWYARLFLLAETRRDVGAKLKMSNFPVHSAGLTQAKDCEIMASTAVSFRTDVFREYLFDVDLTGYVMAEDNDLSYRVSRRYRLVTSPEAVFRHSKSLVSRDSPSEQERRRILFTQYFFQKNMGGSRLRQLARFWSLFGMVIRYLYKGLRHGDMRRFRGLLDGVRAASRNNLFRFGGFVAGPLDQ